MKTKNYFISIAMLFISMVSSQAQVVNGDFETLTPDFFPSNWGANFTFPVTLNVETGESTQDFLEFTNCWGRLCVTSFTPHTGQYALEIGNAFNVTQNQVIPGSAVLFNDASQSSPGWNPGVPLEIGTTINQFGFYYKFTPSGSGNDIAEAALYVFGDSGIIGSARIAISQATNVFEYVYAPVEFTSSETPTFMTVSFNMAKEGSTPTFGTQLIVDDITVNNVALQTNSFQSSAFVVYPTVTRDEITINKGNTTDGNYTFKIINSEGKIVKMLPLNFNTENTSKINVSELSNGIYFLQTQTGSGAFVTKFVKQ